MSERRVKVACINWGHPDAPHALAYIDDPIRGIVAERYFGTWTDAIGYVLDRGQP